MQMVDFEYDGERLSDYGMVVSFFDSNPDTSRVVGGDIAINNVKASGADYYFDTGYQYDEVSPFEFSVIKMNCSYTDLKITDQELNHLFKWLNRKHNYMFKPIYDDDSFANVYYEGTFNIRPIKYGHNIIGLDLLFQPNSPYGYALPQKITHEFNSQDDKLVVYDCSDEYGHIYCDAVINILEDGALRLDNELDVSNPVIIKNCKKGEVLKFYGKIKYIESTLPSHVTLCNDFNYNYPRIKNTRNSNKNVFKCSLKSIVSLNYSPVRKVGIIL